MFGRRGRGYCYLEYCVWFRILVLVGRVFERELVLCIIFVIFSDEGFLVFVGVLSSDVVVRIEDTEEM